MISRLVTVDLILMMSLRLYQVPKMQGSDPLVLYDVCMLVLNQWAKRIEKEGLSVSLQTVTENSLSLFLSSSDQRELIDIGHDEINRAKDIEEKLSLGRVIGLGSFAQLEKLEQAARSGDRVKWSEAAKKIMGVKNSTEAKRRLQRFCVWLPGFVHLDESTKDEYPTLSHLLASAANGECPEIPSELIPHLRELVPIFDKLRNR
jgi:hypothetical protein